MASVCASGGAEIVLFFVSDHLVPTENRQNEDEFPPFPSTSDVLKISQMPSFLVNIDLATTKEVPRRSRKKSDKHRSKEKLNTKLNDTPHSKQFDEKPPMTSLDLTSQDVISATTLKRLSPINVVNFLASELSTTQDSNTTVEWQLPKTPGVCTQSSSTLGPSRSHNLQNKHLTVKSSILNLSNSNNSNEKMTSPLPAVSSVAVTTSQVVTTSQADPRTDVRNITPTPDVDPLDYNDDTESEKLSEELSNLSRSGMLLADIFLNVNPKLFLTLNLLMTT